ncbi:hypothetical protein CJ030_MR0G006092 [Morella rubra]|uniref:Lycopene beta cyclase, chloroplastic n=1 Tax=Morella rubra TaxID=262757 RepID=A0A6A1UKU7_9ROSI|nr:hypothetical protein CJ030_MR0G006092 [Morella rubra]
MVLLQLPPIFGFSQYPLVSPLVQGRGKAESRNLRLMAQSIPSRTQKIMESISVSGEVGGAGGAYSYNALKRLDQLWSSICSAQTVVQEPRQVVSCVQDTFRHSEGNEKALDAFDVLVCGGTLGIFIATALSSKGLRVGIVERNTLKGREQEWNISRKELLELVEAGVLVADDIEQVTAVKFNPNRCGFEGKGEIWVEDILNLGVSPAKLIEIVKRRFVTLGGVIFEGSNVSSICIYEDAAVLQLAEGNILSSSLLIDAMGNFSPVVKQVTFALLVSVVPSRLFKPSWWPTKLSFTLATVWLEVPLTGLNYVLQMRCGRKPDGVCLVVGSCARGFKYNSSSDVIYSSSSVKKVGTSEAQYFWEAFPAGSGPMDRTTYMFTYVDPQPGSPKLEELLEEYWDLMPHYQGVSLKDLEILRVIYGIFPTYRDRLCKNEALTVFRGMGDYLKWNYSCTSINYGYVLFDSDTLQFLVNRVDSPLPAAFNRVLQFGDASGIQSPVSFGGFGSLTRHLQRLTTGIYDAISGNFLDSYNLSLLNPYMPNLSASWLFQRAMSAKQQSNVSPDFINELLHANFQSMQRLGDPVLRPFLQDVVQFVPLAKTLGLVMLTKPQLLPSIFKQVGVPVLLDWSGHFFMLGCYTLLSSFADPIIRPFLSSLPSKMNYEWKRRLEAWKYGAGLDYEL